MDSEERHIRNEEQLDFLRKEFRSYVMSTSESIRNTRKDIETIEQRSVVRNEQMSKLDGKLDIIFQTLNDDSYSKKKGITSTTIENAERISVLETEAKAWKRAAIIIGGLIGGLVTVATYAWAIVKKMITQ